MSTCQPHTLSDRTNFEALQKWWSLSMGAPHRPEKRSCTDGSRCRNQESNGGYTLRHRVRERPSAGGGISFRLATGWNKTHGHLTVSNRASNNLEIEDVITNGTQPCVTGPPQRATLATACNYKKTRPFRSCRCPPRHPQFHRLLRKRQSASRR